MRLANSFLQKTPAYIHEHKQTLQQNAAAAMQGDCALYNFSHVATRTVTDRKDDHG